MRRFPVDAYRCYFVREIPFGQDGNFSWDSMAARYTSELANGIGNLASRVLAMVDSYFEGASPAPRPVPRARMADAAGALAEQMDAASWPST